MHTATAWMLGAVALTGSAVGQVCPVWNMGTDTAPNDTIRQLVVWQRTATSQGGPAAARIVARGNFTAAGGIPAAGVAMYDGGVWTPMSSGWPYGNAGAGVNCLAALGEKVYAAAGALSNDPLTWGGRVWTGQEWLAWPRDGLSGTQSGRTIAVLSGGFILYVEGDFTFPHENPNLVRSRRLAAFDGASWLPLSTTEYGPNIDVGSQFVTINAAAYYLGGLYFAGTFSRIAHGDSYNTGTQLCGFICSYDGVGFHVLPNGGLNNTVTAMTVFDGKLVVAGAFTATADNQLTLNHVAAFDGTAWSRLGGGVSHNVDTLLVADDGTGPKLHIFAGFQPSETAWNTWPTGTDTTPFRGVVRWNGARYSSYGATLSSGINSTGVYSAVRFDPGTGAGIYMGGPLFYGGPTPNLRTFGRWGPGPMTDTDGDGIFDTWEQNGIDADCNGSVDLNLPAMGADWRHKDLFIEVDSMAGRAPAQSTLDRVVTAFAAAPAALVGNPDNQSGVNLHLVVDPADQSIPLAPFGYADPWSGFHALKRQRFGTADERDHLNATAILDAKRRIFHYCVFGERFDAIGSSGLAEIVGDDFMVTLGGFTTPGGTPDQQAATFMHELGHNLGLHHGGHQFDEHVERRFNYKPNYHSVMNYAWQLESNRPGWTLDYSRRAYPSLDENSLDETAGIGGEPGAIALVGPLPAYFAGETGSVDWNRNGNGAEIHVARDVNHVDSGDPATPGDVLEGSEDWSRLILNFRNSDNWAAGVAARTTVGFDDMTQALTDYLHALYTAACPADLGVAGGLPGADGFLDNNDFIAFISYFFAADAHADLGIAGGLPGHDGLHDNNDFIAFIDLFFHGC